MLIPAAIYAPWPLKSAPLMMIAGLIHGFMQRELNHWMDIINASVPFWWVRTFSGGMMLAGFMCMLFNMIATARHDVAYDEELHLVPAEAE